MTKTSRRGFLVQSAAAAVAGSVPYWCCAPKTLADESKSKNDRPRIGCIGVGGRGLGDSRSAARFGDVVAICDVDLNHAEKAQNSLGGKADVCQDYRRLLDRNDVDVVIQGTPDHWHTRINVDACLAGKDVYAEKPLTLTVEEGRILSKVVQETGRIVQVGTQQRSEPQFQTAVALVRNGRIGTLKQVWVALPWYSTKGGPFAPQPVPESLDWDRYQGQAAERTYCPQRAHKTFRWWYLYAGGIVTDWGNHHVDIAHWGLDCDLSGPTSVEARGLFPNEGRPDCFNTPDRFFSRMTYPGGVDVLFFSALNDRRTYGTEPGDPTPPDKLAWLFGDAPEEVRTFDRNGIMFIGDKGRVFVNRGGLYGKPADELAANPLPGDAWRVRPSGDHMANFFECVKTRQEPVAPVRVEHRSVTACHLTNISLRLGRKLAWDPVAEAFVGDLEANGWLSREQRAPYQVTG